MGTLHALAGVAAVLAAAVGARTWLSTGAPAALRRRSSAPGVDEIRTVLSFTSPACPTSVRDAVDARLALPHEPPAVVGLMHVSESSDRLLRIALGNRQGTEWTGDATFDPDGAGGTVGTYRVTRWTTHDGVARSAGITDRMREAREQIADAITSQGGTCRTHLAQVARKA